MDTDEMEVIFYGESAIYVIFTLSFTAVCSAISILSTAECQCHSGEAEPR